MTDRSIKIGIAHGDMNGVSYELMLKAFEDARAYENCIPVIYGSVKALSFHRKLMNLPAINLNVIGKVEDAGINRVNILNVGDEEFAIEPGRTTPESDGLSQAAFDRAFADLSENKIDVLLTAPSVQDYKKEEGLTVFVNDSLRIALATDKMPFSNVAGALSVDLITNKIKQLNYSLVHDFLLTSSRIAVLSLNPGASLRGGLGKEEKELIVPAIEAATAAGVQCFGPYAADELFASDEYMKFDAVLAMYYDQGVVPFRTLSGEEGAVFQAALPYIQTAPDMGVSFEDAGKDVTSSTPFLNAYFLAIDLYKNRAWDKSIHAHPLRKQYFERGSDNEKLDLTKDED